MPLYEYRCPGCRRLTSLLVRTYAPPESPRCPHCGAEGMHRLISRVSTVRSEESRLEGLAEPDWLAGVDENDPRSVARWARHLGREVGEDLGDDFDETVERMEAGEFPEDGEAGEATASELQ